MDLEPSQTDVESPWFERLAHAPVSTTIIDRVASASCTARFGDQETSCGGIGCRSMRRAIKMRTLGLGRQAERDTARDVASTEGRCDSKPPEV